MELKFTCFLNEKGVLHQRSCVARPEENAMARGKHQNLLNVVRSIMFQVAFPDQLWIGCILTTTYLINRIRYESLHNQSPFFKLYGKQPNYSHLRTYDCLPYLYILTPN